MKTRTRVSVLALVCLKIRWAQSPAGFGAVSGTVRDNHGEGMPDAEVVVSNQAMGIRRTMITTDDGVFADPAVTPARGYRLKVVRKGFGDVEITDFDVTVGQTLNLKIDLQPEAPAARVSPVSAMAPAQDTKLGIGTLMTRAEVDALPASERRLDALVSLVPAVSVNPASGQVAFAGVASSNAFVTDGIVTTNTSTGAPRSG